MFEFLKRHSKENNRFLSGNFFVIKKKETPKPINFINPIEKLKMDLINKNFKGKTKYKRFNIH